MVVKERNSGWKLFSSFLGLSQPGLDRDNAGMMFFNFFLEFFGTGRVGTEFETKIFFFLFLRLSQPDLDRNNAEIMFFNFFEIFEFFFFFGFF